MLKFFQVNLYREAFVTLNVGDPESSIRNVDVCSFFGQAKGVIFLKHKNTLKVRRENEIHMHTKIDTEFRKS